MFDVVRITIILRFSVCLKDPVEHHQASFCLAYLVGAGGTGVVLMILMALGMGDSLHNIFSICTLHRCRRCRRGEEVSEE